MTHELDAGTKVGDLAAGSVAARRVLEAHGVDYCCGGSKDLAAAAAEAGADLAALTEDLGKAMCAPTDAQAGADRDWSASTLTELANHIVERHHAYLWANLPRIERLLEKVRQAHAPRHGTMLEATQGVFGGLKQEIDAHLLKEERILFPWIVAMDAHRAGRAPRPDAHCGTVANPIRQMQSEHENAGGALAEMRGLTAGYAPPADACQSFRALYQALAELEADLHEHIHLENNILFPRAVALEGELAGPTECGHEHK